MKALRPAIVLALALFPLVAPATIVTTAADEDNGFLGGGTGISLREAVKFSGAGSTITFAASLSGKTLHLAAGHLVIDKSLTIDASALLAGLTLSADRTGNGKTTDDTYAIHLTGGSLFLDSLILADANCGESSGCITVQPSATFTLTLDHCTLTRNAGYHTAALHCHSYQPQPTDAITIRNCTVSGNSVVKGSSVIDVFFTNLTIQNSTFSQNQAGAIYYRAGGPPATLSILNSTITGNSFQWGASGLHLDLQYLSPPATIYLNNTICTGNASTNILISPGLTLSGANNLLIGNPLLAPLGDYGGPTHTMPPLPGSPAIDAGGPTSLATDQRGFPRIAAPDIGAAEYLTTARLAQDWHSDADGDGSPLGAEIALGTDPATADSHHPRNLAAPVFYPGGYAVLRFGLGADIPGTRWILKRSSTPGGGFQEIYRFNGTTDSVTPGFGVVRTATSISVTDKNPPPGRAFYRFEAIIEP
ncbi:MAG: right-handed parallel beta-helix repeat-containing protein [Verrucomicrobiota bacterium]